MKEKGKGTGKGTTPKEGKLTLHPLSFDEALRKLLEVKPEPIKKKAKGAKPPTPK